MTNHEETDRDDIEKVRQEIMRFRELLDIMRQKLEDGDRAYTQLLAKYSVGDAKTLKHKDLQWKVAERIIHDLAPLSKAVMRARFDARELEHNFEELYDIIVSSPEAKGES